MSLETYFRKLDGGEVPSREEKMNYEGLRLASYDKRPKTFRFSAIKLANAGFSYTGENDTVICLKCNASVRNWASMDQNLDPLALHKQLSPGCPFITNSGENIPFAIPDTKLSPPAKEMKKIFYERFDSREEKVEKEITNTEHSSYSACYTTPMKSAQIKLPARPKIAKELFPDRPESSQLGMNALPNDPKYNIKLVYYFRVSPERNMGEPLSGYSNGSTTSCSTTPNTFDDKNKDSSSSRETIDNNTQDASSPRDEKTRPEKIDNWPLDTGAEPEDLTTAGRVRN